MRNRLLLKFEVFDLLSLLRQLGVHLTDHIFIAFYHLIWLFYLILLKLYSLHKCLRVTLVDLLPLDTWKSIFDLFMMGWDRTLTQGAQNLVRITRKLVNWLIIVISWHSSYLVRIIVVLVSLDYLSHGGVSDDVLRLYCDLMLDCWWVADSRLRMTRFARFRYETFWAFGSLFFYALGGFHCIWWFCVYQSVLVHKILRTFDRELRNTALWADRAKTHILLIIVELYLRRNTCSLGLWPFITAYLRVIQMVVLEIIMV